MKQLNDVLEKGLKAANINLSFDEKEKLIAYVELLNKWNSVHNLTGIKDPESMVSHHILDSLVVMPYLSQQNPEKNPNPKNIIDIGTGAGIPGIPLSIACPNQSFVLLDSNQKKMNFVEHVILSLGLKNVKAVTARVESFKPETLFDWVISRAFSSLKDFILQSGHLCDRNGKLVAMKGKIHETEFKEIPEGFTIERIEKLDVPGIQAERALVFVKPL